MIESKQMYRRNRISNVIALFFYYSHWLNSRKTCSCLSSFETNSISCANHIIYHNISRRQHHWPWIEAAQLAVLRTECLGSCRKALQVWKCVAGHALVQGSSSLYSYLLDEESQQARKPDPKLDDLQNLCDHVIYLSRFIRNELVSQPTIKLWLLQRTNENQLIEMQTGTDLDLVEPPRSANRIAAICSRQERRDI